MAWYWWVLVWVVFLIVLVPLMGWLVQAYYAAKSSIPYRNFIPSGKYLCVDCIPPAEVPHTDRIDHEYKHLLDRYGSR